MRNFTRLTLLFLVLYSAGLVSSQFPAICVQNATLVNSTCCPIPPGFTEPCGGPGRGRCIRLQSTDDLSNVPDANLIDDRFDWPTSFFENACSCAGNFSGYMCHECWYGFTGPNCNQTITVTRKDARTLTVAEKQRFVSLLEVSMNTPSDYMVLNTSQSSDPSINPQFLNVSVYQFLSYLHYYVSRKTNFRNDTMCDNPDLMWPDFAHGGPGFPVWHRLYSLKWERALQQIAGDDTFALPYWNWTDGGGACDVCTDDFLGSLNLSAGTISSTSAFSSWRIMCSPPENGCQTCDPYADNGPIIRRPGANPRYPVLPTSRSAEYVMSLSFFDLEPYSVRSPNIAFRNVLEGYANEDGPSIDNSSFHNLVHSFLNGTMSELSTAAMDPIFLVHHTFIDKLFETWLRRNRATARRLPLVGAQPGHNRNSVLVPFFPLEQAFEFFRRSPNFGYQYDDMQEENSDQTSGFLMPSWIAVILEAGVILVLLVVIVIFFKNRRKAHGYKFVTKTTSPNEEESGLNERQPMIKKDKRTKVDKLSYETY